MVSIHENISIFCVRVIRKIKGVNTVRNSWIISLTRSSTDPHSSLHTVTSLVKGCDRLFCLLLVVFFSQVICKSFQFYQRLRTGAGQLSCHNELVGFSCSYQVLKIPHKTREVGTKAQTSKKHKKQKAQAQAGQCPLMLEFNSPRLKRKPS